MKRAKFAKNATIAKKKNRNSLMAQGHHSFFCLADLAQIFLFASAFAPSRHRAIAVSAGHIEN